MATTTALSGLGVDGAEISSMGTLVSCPLDGSGCLWMGESGDVVDAHMLQRLLLAEADIGDLDQDAALRNLQTHMTYIEQVHRYAQSVGHAFSYKMGVHERHLLSASDTMIAKNRPYLPEAFVHREMKHSGSRVAVRQLSTTANTANTTIPTALNWCTAENPENRSVCSGVKSQKNCGSCWAFAASDAIETAVAIAANQSVAVALAPQQFLSCSRRETEQTFTYCWVGSGSLQNSGNGPSWASWMGVTMRWRSVNNGCSGGMTHGAFMDAAQLRYGLVTELELPYDDKSSTSTPSSSLGSNTTCGHASNQTAAAASISDWKQVVGKDCSLSRDPNVLLKNALQTQPIAVALNAEYPFADYKGGLYSCPNNGNLASQNDVNHALLLVGYGSDAQAGDYWILKNSYSNSWGENGFMRLLADSKANCGLNLFPVVPTGAKAGVAMTTVDGGGEKLFVGMSLHVWLIIAIAVAGVTVVLTVIGLIWSTRQRAAMRARARGGGYVRY